MPNFGEILVPVDYSACSDDALRMAGTLARALHARLLVLHLLPISVSGFMTYPPMMLDRRWIEEETDRLRVHVDTVLGEDAPSFEVCVDWGSPHLDIVPFAVERKADLIVIGTHGRTGVKHVLLGSVAEKTVRLAPCPVLTVRAGYAADRALGRVDVEPMPLPEVRDGEVGRLAARHAVTIDVDDLLSTARDRMASIRARHLPVVDDGRLVGMLSDRDLAAHAGHLEHKRVNAAMTHHPTSIAPDASVETAARLMIEGGVRALPVVEGERVVGVLSVVDILEDYVRAARRAA